MPVAELRRCSVHRLPERPALPWWSEGKAAWGGSYRAAFLATARGAFRREDRERVVVPVHRTRGASFDVDRIAVHAGATRREKNVWPQLVSNGGPGWQAFRGTLANAPDSTAMLTRADLASHLGLSVRSVDRIIERHRLKSGSGRPVLVRLESYAWCLVTLRRQSTRSIAPVPVVRLDTPSPLPLQPGEDLLLVAHSDGSGPFEDALQSIAPGCRIRTLDECPAEHWGWSLIEAAEAMAGVSEAMASGTSNAEPEGNSTASCYLRELLRQLQVGTGQTLDAAVLARCLRRLHAGERRLLLEALSGEVVDSARSASDAPLAYAREPLLTEEELAREVRRTIATVRRWRVEGTGPVFLRIERAVRYSRVDVNHWLGERRVR